MNNKQQIMLGVSMLLVLVNVLYLNIYLTTIQDTKTIEETKVEVVDELKFIYDTEDVNVLDTLENSDEHVMYEVLVEDVIKQVIYMKDGSDVVVIEQ